MKTRLPQTAKHARNPGRFASAVTFECRRRLRGIMLVECVVYIALLFLVLGFAYQAFYSCWDTSIGLRRNADDIMRALDVGEAWRQDIRSARGPIRLETTNGVELLHIPLGNGEVLYRLTDGELQRSPAGIVRWVTLLSKIKSSHMQSDPRARVTAWRWELELNRVRNARVRPLFTFQAVPPNSTTP
jgi:hypothetical protein